VFERVLLMGRGSLGEKMKCIDNYTCRIYNKRSFRRNSGDMVGNRKSYIIIEEKGQIYKRPWTAASFNRHLSTPWIG
jgi:hypothetical protein